MHVIVNDEGFSVDTANTKYEANRIADWWMKQTRKLHTTQTADEYITAQYDYRKAA